MAKTRKEIEQRVKESYGNSQTVFECVLEVLLDIRDALSKSK